MELRSPMVDIHSHILWGLDDGAKTFEDSLAMARLAKECGTTDIVATPHANARYPFDAAVNRQKTIRAAISTSAFPISRALYSIPGPSPLTSRATSWSSYRNY